MYNKKKLILTRKIYAMNARARAPRAYYVKLLLLWI